MITDNDVPLLIDTSEKHGDVCEPRNAQRVPITVVTGYLGSGKSTMLEYLTRTNHRKRIAIILNEFGATADIERSLTVKKDGAEVEEWLELENGCLCCTAKDAGVTAIENLMQRKGNFDYIILETTGIADPAPIASMFWLDKGLFSNIELDGIVAVVDALNIDKNLADGDTATVQIATADVIVLNKTDKVPSGRLAEIKGRILAINSSSPIFETTFGQVDLEHILDLHAYSTVSLQESQVKFHSSAQHDNDISTVSLLLDISTGEQLSEVERKLQNLLWEHEFEGSLVEIHRAKGKFNYGGRTKILQAVREVYEFIESQAESGPSKLVLIGRGIAGIEDALQKHFSGAP